MLLAQIARQFYEETVKAYGHEPTWSEFKAALSRKGAIYINDNVAKKLAYNRMIYTTSAIFMKGLTDLLSVVIVPTVAGFWAFTGISAWWILSSFIAAMFMMKHSGKAQQNIIVEAASKDERIYTDLLRMGAFSFKPA